MSPLLSALINPAVGLVPALTAAACLPHTLMGWAGSASHLRVGLGWDPACRKDQGFGAEGRDRHRPGSTAGSIPPSAEHLHPETQFGTALAGICRAGDVLRGWGRAEFWIF